ncbi:MAG TPA: invasin domain 3-containing protein, partial [Verrucomicrobiae bacterium]|nr:invasin domain 3-containing protein [Verrucomicrobiae bacterium]
FSYNGNSQYIHSGASSISVTVTNGYGALYLEHADFSSTPYGTLTFWVNGGPTGGQVLAVQGTLGGVNQNSVFTFTPAANTWKQINIPLASLGVANQPNFDGIWIQNNSGSPIPVFYVDDMSLIPPAPPSSGSNTVITANPSSLGADGRSAAIVTVQARDRVNNNLTSSGGIVTLSTSSGSISGVTDNSDGTYTAILTAPTVPGLANITGTIAGSAIGNPAAVTFTPGSTTLVITNIQTPPATAQLAWNAFPGQSYSVLSSSNIAASLSNWTPASVGVSGQFIDSNRLTHPDMFYRVKENINPNPIISLGKPTAGVTAQQFQNAAGMDDGIFGTFATTWNAGYPTPAVPAWVAINIGTGPTRVLLEWNASGNYNYQETDYGGPGNYAILTSSNSTTGADGTWTQVASVTNNIYRTRSHSFDFTGMKWVKMLITAAPTDSTNGAQMDEIEVYDISAAYNRGRRAEDTWFFMGDSITAFWADRTTANGTPPAYTNDPTSHMPDFAQLIHSYSSNYFPSMIDGGIGGETTANGLARLPQTLADNPDYYYWALDYGANDAAGNTANTTSFKANMQAMINLVLASGRMPVIPHLSYASDGEHNNIPLFNAVVDQLVATNHILAGPDCYTFFLANTNQLSDGLHPTDAGMRSYNLLWAQQMRYLYP